MDDPIPTIHRILPGPAQFDGDHRVPGACPALRPALAVGLAADSPGVLAAGTALALVPRQRMRGGDQGKSLVYGIKNVCVCMYVFVFMWG